MANVENAAAPSVWDRPVRPEGGRLPFYGSMPVAGMPIVRADPAGDGAFFGARRNPDGTRRPHYGIDLEATPGDPVLAPFNGVVEMLGFVYGQDHETLGEFRSITIRGDNGTSSRLFYVAPTPGLKVGDLVKVGQTIGTVQDRAAKTPGMDNHVHWELWTGALPAKGAREGARPVDPTPWVKRQRLLHGHRRR